MHVNTAWPPRYRFLRDSAQDFFPGGRRVQGPGTDAVIPEKAARVAHVAVEEKSGYQVGDRPRRPFEAGLLQGTRDIPHGTNPQLHGRQQPGMRPVDRIAFIDGQVPLIGVPLLLHADVRAFPLIRLRDWLHERMLPSIKRIHMQWHHPIASELSVYAIGRTRVEETTAPDEDAERPRRSALCEGRVPIIIYITKQDRKSVV